jgi:hypothetical protein
MLVRWRVTDAVGAVRITLKALSVAKAETLARARTPSMVAVANLLPDDGSNKWLSSRSNRR